MSASQFAGLGFQLAASIFLFLYLGKWVDGKLGTAPAFLIVGVFVGAAAGFYAMIRALRSAPRQAPRDGGTREGR
ncbi:MAG TPA: AtpZ/AtpI family protein [Gemmatimonadaceae bacterium]